MYLCALWTSTAITDFILVFGHFDIEFGLTVILRLCDIYVHGN